jgi:Na+-transporting NADH:ubiquinone oxidoreductase subunit F
MLNYEVFLNIIIATLVFFSIILLLVLILVYAKSKLTQSGPVKITINNEKEIITQAGNSLLTTLANNQIFLPSACGGGGTCGMCKCQVFDNSEILPTEIGFFTRKQIQQKWRLGCQVKVKNDLNIKIPEEVLGIKKWECTVVSNRNVATFIKEFVVKLPDNETLNFHSGGYIQIDVPKCSVDFKKDIFVEEDFRDEWNKYNMWDLKMVNKEPSFRAYSMANHPAENNIIMLNVRIATPPWNKNTNSFMKVNPGICSSYIFSRKPGDKVSISGPYGEFFVKDTNREMMFIGGGAGMAPMRSHIFDQFITKKTTRKTTFWYGARSKREIFYEEHFRNIEKQFHNFKFTIALSEPKPEDNWTGLTGFIHQVIYDQYLSKHPAPEDIEYYLCGPPAMNDAVLKMLDNLGVPPDMIAFDDFGG